jgi:hypothetical protein
MDTRELIEVADRLLIVAARLLEDIHPALVAGEASATAVAGKAAALAKLADQLLALSRCAATLTSLADASELTG